MSRFYIGQIVRTNYNTGPYRIVKISEERTDPGFFDMMKLGDKAPKSKPHRNLTVKHVEHKPWDKHTPCYLNGYDENLNNVWSSDRLIDCAEETMLLALTIQ